MESPRPLMQKLLGGRVKYNERVSKEQFDVR